ncbi:MAG: TIGR01244 family sulfur transferase [Gammaproteobacteria bacterium]
MHAPDITRHTPAFATSPQLQPEDLAAIAAAGFRSVINNRPDREGGDEQPTSATLQAAAARAGLRYVYMPTVPSEITAQTVETFARHLAELPAPVLAFCYSGGRATRLFRLATGG